MQTMNANSQNEIPVWFMDGSQTLLSNSLPSRMNEWTTSLMFEAWPAAWRVAGWVMRSEVWRGPWESVCHPANCLGLAWPYTRDEEGGGEVSWSWSWSWSCPVLSCPLSWLEEAEAMGRCDRALAAGSSPLTYWHTVVSQYQPAQLHTNISPPVCPQCSRYKTGQQLGKQWDLAGNYNSSS